MRRRASAPTEGPELSHCPDVPVMPVFQNDRTTSPPPEVEERYRALLDLMTDAVLVLQDDVIRLCNPAGRKLLGGTQAERVIGQHIERFLAAADWALAGERRRHLLSTGSVLSRHPFRMNTLDGRAIEVESSGTPCRLDGMPAIQIVLHETSSKLRADREIQRSHRLLDTIRRTQERFLVDPDPGLLFERMLQELLDLTESRFGFVGEILRDSSGQPFLRTRAISNISWNDESRRMYESSQTGGLDFRNLDTLFGSVIRTGKLLIANQPASDPRRGGLPAGHPPLHSFLGLPVHFGGQLVGVIGLANRPGGYDEQGIADLDPVLSTCAHVLVAHRDRIQRLEAEAALRRSEEHLRAIIEAEPQCIKLVAADGRLLEMNPAGLAMIEAPDLSEVVGQCVFDLIAPEYRPKYEQFHRSVLGGWRGSLEFDIIGLCGSRRRMQSQGVPFRSRDDGPAVLTVTVDVTEREHASIALRESEERYRSVVEGSMQGILVHQDGIVCYANAALARMFDYDGPEELIGRPLWDTFTHPENLEMLKDRTQRLLNGERLPPHPGWRGRGKFGREVWVATSASLIELNGRPAIVAHYLDVTERELAERERKKLEVQLRHSQKLESLGVLAGGIAHDFNNLLTVVLGNAGMARMAIPPGSPLGCMIEEIEKAGQRAAELAQQMLAYSGKGKFVLEVLDLDRLVGEMARLLETVVSKKAIIQRQLQPARIEGDPVQVRQVVMNMITNASDALEGHVGTIGIRTGTRFFTSEELHSPFSPDVLPAGEYAYIEVSDSGCGMTEETQARIFDPFFTTKFAGRGLGLAAVLGIVRGHRGTIQVRSRAGEGTLFTVLIPTTSATTPLPVGDSQETPRSWTGLVLVVEDEEGIRSLARSILERAGYRVLTAGNGIEGLSRFEQHAGEITAILLDMTMPEMDGLEFLQALRDHPRRPPVVLMSGFAESELGGKLHGLGRTEFLQKPFRPRDLSRQVHQLHRGPE